MGPVSVYRAGAVGAGSAHLFGGGAPASDLTHAAWLGWLPLALVDWAGPDIAEAGDTWLTDPPGRSKSGPVVPGDVVTVDDAAGELLARRERGLETYTACPGDFALGGRLSDSLVAVSVSGDIAVQVVRLWTAHETWVASVGVRDRDESQLGDGCQLCPRGASPAGQSRGRSLRGLQEAQLRLHLLLEAAVRIGVFDPASSSGSSRRRGLRRMPKC